MNQGVSEGWRDGTGSCCLAQAQLSSRAFSDFDVVSTILHFLTREWERKVLMEEMEHLTFGLETKS